MDSNRLTDFKSEEHFFQWFCKPEPLQLELQSRKEITQTMMGDNFDWLTHQNSIFGLHYEEPFVGSSRETELISCQLPPPSNLNLEFQEFDDFDWFDDYFPPNYDSSSIINLPPPPPPQEQPPPLLQVSIGESWSEILSKTERERVGSSSSKTADGDGKRKCSRRSKTIEIELDEIRKHFNVPITRAAREMKIGLTVLKKRCRELQISRWPHRKIKSLASLIENVKEMGLAREVEMLEEHRRLMEKLPEVELTENTKKLRQACFKAKYKKRRSSLAPVLP